MQAPPVPSSGRAYHRGAVSGSGQVQASDTASQLSSMLSSAHLGSAGSEAQGDSNSGNGNGSGSGPSVGRGATRGRRERAQEFFVKTRPDKLETKQGTGGQEIAVAANYFELIAKVSCVYSSNQISKFPFTSPTGGCCSTESTCLPTSKTRGSEKDCSANTGLTCPSTCSTVSGNWIFTELNISFE